QAVDERELIGERLAERVTVRTTIKREAAVGLARADDHAQPGLAREVQHDPVVRKAMHEERAITEIGRVHDATLEEGVAVAVAAVGRVDAQAELGSASAGIEREVRNARER